LGRSHFINCRQQIVNHASGRSYGLGQFIKARFAGIFPGFDGRTFLVPGKISSNQNVSRRIRGRRRNRGIASLLFPAWSREKRLQLLRRQALITSRPRAEDETEAVTAKIAADLRPGCRPFPIAGAAPGYARDQTVAIDNLYDI
jgi:hypothetical protein